MPLADFETSVADLVRDRDSVINADQLALAVATALAQYSADSPRRVVVDVEAEDAGDALPLPAGWTADSVLVSAEFPPGNWPPSYIDGVEIYTGPEGSALRLPLQLAAGDTVRLAYTAAHLLDDTDDSVPARHRNAVASLAASMLCGQLASYYAGESEATIAADTVDRRSKSDLWRARARDLLAVYTAAVGVSPNDRKKPASAIANVKGRDSLGGARLFHPPRNWPRA